MNVAMIGCGYVGLVSAACFADFGHTVHCVDTDERKISALLAGRIPIFEPGLSEIVERGIKTERLKFSTDLTSAVRDSSVVFIAVGTPSRRGDGHADLTYIFGAVEQIAKAIADYKVIVTKSTVPVGTGDEIELRLGEHQPRAMFDVVSNPEFLREGAAVNDFKLPNRIIIGTSAPKAEAVMRELYRPLALNQLPMLVCSRRGAELIKYSANAFLAMKVAFINEVADLCEAVDADIQEVSRGIGLDNRIGSKFLHAGPGYGGSCFPKDTVALMRIAQDAGVPMRLVETVVSVNDQRKRTISKKIFAACDGTVRGKVIAVLGLTFKSNTDDIRDSPSIGIITALQDAGAKVRAFDPQGMDQARAVLEGVEFATDPYSCARGASALAIVTEWEMFRALDLKRIRSELASPVIVDFRNIYPPNEVAAHGLRYIGVGRGEQTFN